MGRSRWASSKAHRLLRPSDDEDLVAGAVAPADALDPHPVRLVPVVRVRADREDGTPVDDLDLVQLKGLLKAFPADDVADELRLVRRQVDLVDLDDATCGRRSTLVVAAHPKEEDDDQDRRGDADTKSFHVHVAVPPLLRASQNDFRRDFDLEEL